MTESTVVVKKDTGADRYLARPIPCWLTLASPLVVLLLLLGSLDVEELEDGYMSKWGIVFRQK